jgi:NDP-sugar pyrophosphorylase family protein
MKDIAKVFVLAGGLGTRLSSITQGTPKALVNINGTPFLELQLNWLEQLGAHEIIILAGYGAEYIKQYLKNRKHSRLTISVIVENRVMGTGGAILNGSELIGHGEPFVVVNGDSLLDIDLSKFCSFGKQKKNCFVIGVSRVEKSIDYGFIEFDKNLNVISFSEKNSENMDGWVNAGIYYFPANYIDSAASISPISISLENDLIPQWLKSKKLMMVYKVNGGFVDIGTPSRLIKFIERQSVNGDFHEEYKNTK